RLLSAASARAMRTKTASYKGIGFADFGLGWMLMPGGVIGHGGGGPGILSQLYIHPASSTAISVLTNAAHGAGLIGEMARPVLEPLGIKLPASAVAEMVKQATDSPVRQASY